MRPHRRRRSLSYAAVEDQDKRLRMPAEVRRGWPLAAAGAAVVCALVLHHPSPTPPASDPRRTSDRRADFGAYAATPAAHWVADWAAASDAGGGPFIVIDKPAATIYVFDAEGRVLGSAPVLLGAAIGDDTVPGIGDKPLDKVLPEEKTTPAGRFVGEPGRNARGEDVVWVDYDAAVSMHRVITFNAAERRLERLQTPTVEDNRISYGCINVPVEFYEAYVRPAYARRNAVVYVLPDVKPLNEVFPLGAGASAVRLHPSLRDGLAALR
jgi:hypothetical protein